jgi:hypothetical protein
MRKIGIAWAFMAGLATASVTKVHVIERNDYLGGKEFGPAGAYERVFARAHFALDPKQAANAAVRDLDQAEVDAQGMVTFSADVFVLKPRDPAKGNGTLLFEVSNRGGKGLASLFQFATGPLAHAGKNVDDPRSAGDAFLLERGYTLVWAGWQFDVREDAALLRLYPPLTQRVEAMIRSEFVPTARTKTMNLGDRDMIAYAATGPVSLTVRDSRDGKRKAIEAGWKLNAAKTAIEMDDGFAPFQIYEAIYTTKNPAVAGTGLAAVRDFISFLRYENRGETLLGDQRRWIKRTIAFGTSQSGRFLRQYLYDGFNADEKGRVVFDGVWANVAGGGRGSFNLRGAQPSRDGHPTFNYFYPSDVYPFTDLPYEDALAGKKEGLLDRVKRAPKIFYTHGSYEYWGRSAALIHVTPDGKRDAEMAPHTRIYYVAGSQHGPGRVPPPREGLVNFANANDYRPLYRALLLAMEAWIAEGTAPPESVYPRLDRGELVDYEKLKLTNEPRLPQRAWRVDYASEPPRIGAVFPLLVPKVGADGNELGGIRMPEVAAPLALYRGWNYRAGPDVPKNRVFDMTGSTLPKEASAVRREYPNRAAYEAKIRNLAREMAGRRLLLERDEERVVKRAGDFYDWVVAQ